MYEIVVCYMSCLLHPEQFAPQQRTVLGGKLRVKLFRNPFLEITFKVLHSVESRKSWSTRFCKYCVIVTILNEPADRPKPCQTVSHYCKWHLHKMVTQ